MARRGDNIHKRKDGRWEGRYISYYDNDGKAKYKSIYGHKYKDVKAKLENLKAEKVTICNNIEYTLGELVIMWINDPKKRTKKTTKDKYFQIYKNHIRDNIGNIILGELTVEILDDFISNKSEKYSITYVKSMIIVINSSLKLGKEKGFIINELKINIPNIKKQKIQTLTSAEYCKLSSHIKYKTDATGLGIILSLYAGLRIGEVCALKWENIDFESDIINISQSVLHIKNEKTNKYEYVIGPPKTDTSIRTIPIIENLKKILIQEKDKSTSDFVISKDNKNINIRTFEYRYHNLLNEVIGKDYNFHVLRHTFATMCVDKGVDVKTISEILGHSNVSFTLNTYVHPTIQQKKKQLEKINNNGQDYGQK